MLTIHPYLSLSSFKEILVSEEPITFSDTIPDKVEESFQFLKAFAIDKVIYGVNTGFGPMAQYKIPEKDLNALQYNLIRSHCTGMGTPLEPLHIKAAVLARIQSLSQGYSGVHISVLYLMKEFINRNMLPVIYQHGGVGASGDLVQLAHLALTLIGEGEVLYQGKVRPTQEVFAEEGLRPVEIHLREGLALMNGTSVMSGIGIVNSMEAGRLLELSIAASCAINEIVAAYDDHFSQELNAAKLHPAQQDVAEMMRRHLSDSRRIRKRDDHLYKTQEEEVFKDKVQEYYSVRCVPQILGPVLETIRGVERTLEQEINSANDNPIVDVNHQQVFHGGNFHGDFISLEMDKLKLVVTKLTILAERQLNYLLNHKINDVLPPFVNRGRPGLNFGMQGAQFTATSTTAESQTLSQSMYIHSIPNNNDNQDVVSMGTNAALLTSRVIDNAFDVLTIEWITIIQAVDILAIQDKISSRTLAYYHSIRQRIPESVEDVALFPYLKAIKELFKNLRFQP
ncbi:MAG: aromatic amino acid ammonia-lyase [Taibaiella sp.]|nr:aromatic amino acid ammonia-lyase [Taibaiella sp.]